MGNKTKKKKQNKEIGWAWAVLAISVTMVWGSVGMEILPTPIYAVGLLVSILVTFYLIKKQHEKET